MVGAELRLSKNLTLLSECVLIEATVSPFCSPALKDGSLCFGILICKMGQWAHLIGFLWGLTQDGGDEEFFECLGIHPGKCQGDMHLFRFR